MAPVGRRTPDPGVGKRLLVAGIDWIASIPSSVAPCTCVSQANCVVPHLRAYTGEPVNATVEIELRDRTRSTVQSAI